MDSLFYREDHQGGAKNAKGKVAHVEIDEEGVCELIG